METKPQEIGTVPAKPPVSGLGGWLIVVQIGLYGILLNKLSMLMSAVALGDGRLIILLDIVVNAALIALILYTLPKFYGRKKIVPTLLIVFTIGNVLVEIVDWVMLRQLVDELAESSNFRVYRDLIRAVLTCLLGIPYLLRSARVRNTFVH